MSIVNVHYEGMLGSTNFHSDPLTRRLVDKKTTSVDAKATKVNKSRFNQQVKIIERETRHRCTNFRVLSRRDTLANISSALERDRQAFLKSTGNKESYFANAIAIVNSERP